MPGLIRSAIKYKRAVHVGKGANVWSNVHIEDLADFFVLLLEKSLEGKAPKNDDGFYFTENGSNNFKEPTDKIGHVLHQLGIASDATSADLDPATAATVMSPSWLPAGTGHNSRCTAKKARNLGWKPHRPGLMADIEETVKRISKEKQ